ncbi:MAG: DUF3307 domain-containing protein [Bdellovibrionales bacterium]
MTINVELLLTLIIIFHVKHFLADFVFQNVYMLQKSRPGWDFVPPLSIHCGIHAAGTLALVGYFSFSFWWLAILDFVVHFVMDRIKAGPRYFGRFNDMRSKAFWVTFGFDQMVHHLTHLYICWYIVTHVGG